LISIESCIKSGKKLQEKQGKKKTNELERPQGGAATSIAEGLMFQIEGAYWGESE